MATLQNRIVDQLDNKLKPFQKVQGIPRPQQGWIKTIRTSLNMTLDQLGNTLNMSKQGARNIEQNESKGSISLNSLREAGQAMNLKLVYGFVPIDGSMEDMIEKRAKQVATKIVMRTAQNMALENQGLAQEKLDKSIRDLAAALKSEMRRSLWD